MYQRAERRCEHSARLLVLLDAVVNHPHPTQRLVLPDRVAKFREQLQILAVKASMQVSAHSGHVSLWSGQLSALQVHLPPPFQLVPTSML